MKKIALLVLLILFAGMGLAVAAEDSEPYWINPDVTEIYFTADVPAGGTVNYYAKPEAGYSPDGENTFDGYIDGSTLSGWTGHTEYLSIDNNRIHVSGGSVSDHHIYSPPFNIQEKFVFEYEVEYVDVNNFYSYAKIQNSNYESYLQIKNYEYYDYFHVSASTNDSVGYSTGKYRIKTIVDTNSNTVSSTVYDIDDNVVLSISDAGFLDVGASYTGDVIFDQIIGTDYTNDYIGWIRVYQYADTTTTVTDMGSYYKISITNNEATDLTGYQVQLDAATLGITSDTESWHFYPNPDPEVAVNLTNPPDNSYINHSNFTFDITGNGDINASLYIDNVSKWNATSITNVTHTVNLTGLSEGSHEWYVNASATGNNTTVYNTSDVWSFTYDITDPNASIVDVNPDSENVANETMWSADIKWSDANLQDASFYVDTGDGYTLNDTTDFASSDWFNVTINTTGLVGKEISWKQVVNDKAGNSYTYSDSFIVIESELNIYVYDEKTGAQILPSSVVVYNENLSREATITEATKIASLSYDGLETAKYIVSVDADSYYQRNSIVNVDVTSLTELNVYLPSENETVIFDKFILSDNTNTYEESDCILRLDKPLPNGTDTVFSTYFDFDGVTSTYLIAADQYLLYIETPDRTINYGWLTPDSDGEININLQDIQYNKYYDDWLVYSFNSDNETQTISLDYESAYSVNNVLFTVRSNEEEVYNSSIDTDTGSFTFNTGEEGEYIASVEIDTLDENFTRDWVVTFGEPDKVQFFPDSYPEWLTSIIILCIIIVSALALSAYRADLAAVSTALIYAAGVYNDWVPGNEYTVSVIAIIAVGALIKFQRKNDRSIT